MFKTFITIAFLSLGSMAADMESAQQTFVLAKQDHKPWHYEFLNIQAIPDSDVDYFIGYYRGTLQDQFGPYIAKLLNLMIYQMPNENIYTDYLKKAYAKNFTDPEDKTLFNYFWYVFQDPTEKKAGISLNSLRYNGKKVANLGFSDNLQPESLLLFLDRISRTEQFKGQTLIVHERADNGKITNFIHEVNKLYGSDYIKFIETKDTDVDFVLITKPIPTNFYQIVLPS